VIWFLIVLIHAVNCPGKCSDVPAVTIQMPSQDVCVAVKAANPDLPLECWAKPGPGGAK
jgi:hypothetical protein